MESRYDYTMIKCNICDSIACTTTRYGFVVTWQCEQSNIGEKTCSLIGCCHGCDCACSACCPPDCQCDCHAEIIHIFTNSV